MSQAGSGGRSKVGFKHTFLSHLGPFNDLVHVQEQFGISRVKVVKEASRQFTDILPSDLVQILIMVSLIISMVSDGRRRT